MKVAIIPARGETQFICQSSPVDDDTDTKDVGLICNTIVTIAIFP